MAIPYMGSKRKSAQKIYQTIVNFNPNLKTIVDLFCGGFAIGELFYKNGFNVIANDKNKYVVALLEQTINKGLDELKCLEFITRAKFEDVLKNPNNYEYW
jgi:adenine-specific DNA methylase